MRIRIPAPRNGAEGFVRRVRSIQASNATCNADMTETSSGQSVLFDSRGVITGGWYRSKWYMSTKQQTDKPSVWSPLSL